MTILVRKEPPDTVANVVYVVSNFHGGWGEAKELDQRVGLVAKSATELQQAGDNSMSIDDNP